MCSRYRLPVLHPGRLARSDRMFPGWNLGTEESDESLSEGAVPRVRGTGFERHGPVDGCLKGSP